MNVIGNDIFGIGFAVLAAILVFLMYYLWRFPYDKVRNKSEAPAALILLHRGLGWVFVAVYVYMMWDMLPRLWTYQIELPARTVAHLLLGMAIGAILFIKIVIVRFFKHMEAALVPFLGTSLLVCTLLLLGLALPTTFREGFLRDAALMGGNMTQERLVRVREQLPKAGIVDAALLEELATETSLLEGRGVLVTKCVQCHDLRTILARPKTPDGWRQTVRRMATRSSVLDLIGDEEQLRVTAYLVAISPTLQQTARLRLEEEMKSAEAQQAITSAAQRVGEAPSAAKDIDLAAAQSTFQARCSQCHSPLLVEGAPPRSERAAIALVTRMVRNGLRAEERELAEIIGYLAATYAAPAAPAGAPAQGGDAGAAVDQEIVLRPAGTELRFETPAIEAKAGARVRVVLDNPAASGLTHNFVLVRDSQLFDDVATAALGAPDTGFVPVHEQVVASIPAQPAGSRAMAEFTVPGPGEYHFGCMMPGHGFTMRGTLTVSQ